MPSFAQDFIDSRGQPIHYKGKVLHMSDRILVDKLTSIKVRRLKTTSDWRQGIALDTKGVFTIEGEDIKNKTALWEDTAPSEVLVKVNSRDGMLRVKNIWDIGNGVIEAWVRGAAMIIEEIPNGRRYYCNDGHPDENFDDIVFEVIILK